MGGEMEALLQTRASSQLQAPADGLKIFARSCNRHSDWPILRSVGQSRSHGDAFRGAEFLRPCRLLHCVVMKRHSDPLALSNAESCRLQIVALYCVGLFTLNDEVARLRNGSVRSFGNLAEKCWLGVTDRLLAKQMQLVVFPS